MSLMLPAIRGVQEDRAADAAEKRAAEALLDGADRAVCNDTRRSEETLIEVDASRTMSASERLRHLDFEQMSTAEVAEAKRMLARLSLAGGSACCRGGMRPRSTGQPRRSAPHPARCACATAARVQRIARKANAHALAQPCGAVRYLGLDVAIFAAGFAFHPCGGQCQRSGLGAGAWLHLWHTADQHHPPSAPPRCGSGAGCRRGAGTGLVGRHPDRGLPARLSTAIGRAVCWGRGRWSC